MPHIDGCRVCGSHNLEIYLNLGDQPWCNGFLTKEQFKEEKKYPLQVALCHDCFTSQLNYTIPKENMFSNHTYVSGTTTTLKTHFLKLAEEVKQKYDVQPNDFVVDIGGNDGTNLLQYKKIGVDNLLNVESASNIAEISINNGIETITDYFNEDVADKILSERGHAKLVLASGVFFHLEELHSVCRGIQKLLDKDGVFVVQFMYYKSIIENLNYDSIYSEHLLYYTISSITYLLSLYDIFPDDLTYSEIHGGSIVLFGRLGKRKQTLPQSFIHGIEKPMFNVRTYTMFSRRVLDHANSLCDLLDHIRDKGARIHGYGAPAKGNTLINYASLREYLEVIEESNTLKCGLYTPQSHIPVVHYSEIKERPSHYLVLAWNFLEEFLRKEMEYIQNGGKFIIPFPYKTFIVDVNNVHFFC
jgi:hypothetical protein